LNEETEDDYPYMGFVCDSLARVELGAFAYVLSACRALQWERCHQADSRSGAGPLAFFLVRGT
jgi:hypothetical protein